MSDNRLEKARALIRQERYAEARAILEQSPDPEAADWLLMLNRVESSAGIMAAQTMGLLFAMTGIMTGLIMTGIVFSQFLRRLNRPRAK